MFELIENTGISTLIFFAVLHFHLYPSFIAGFASGSLSKSVHEPASGSTAVRVTVIRNGGTSGTVQVEWNATLNGHLASSDVTPSSGNVRFLSGENSQDITLSILADDIPEDNEVRQSVSF